MGRDTSCGAQGLLTLGDFVLIQSYLAYASLTSSWASGFNLRQFYDAFADAGEMVDMLESPA